MVYSFYTGSTSTSNINYDNGQTAWRSDADGTASGIHANGQKAFQSCTDGTASAFDHNGSRVDFEMELGTGIKLALSHKRVTLFIFGRNVL
ncbi:unnamed protein product [Adineta steineri]|uniref:Uncharacterized protein n=1 Tax=Adineta steineri TaxID=433720 RepID=A0A815PF92_9BILA|nr:unnamed protein product [Adineta steineri]CAF3867950.1 unnamed protein product [Adineta steineri]